MWWIGTGWWQGLTRQDLTRAAGVAVLAGIAAAPLVAPGASAPALADVIGSGWASFMGCAACIGGAALIVAGGPGAVLAALYYPGGAVVGATCVATCIEYLNG